jgi:hypothetical protein
MTRGLGEGSSPEGIGGGEFRRRCGQTVMSSQEEGGGVLCLKRSHTDEGETERSTMATLSHREEKMGPAQRVLRRRRGVSGRHDVAVGVVGTWHWQWCRSDRCGQRSGGAIEARAKVRGGSGWRGCYGPAAIGPKEQ